MWNEECGDVQKMRWGNFVNFSYKQKQDVFRQYKYCYCITKVQNDCYNKTNLKTISIAEMNVNVEHAFTVLKRIFQLANSTQIFILLLFKKSCKSYTVECYTTY